MKYYLKRRCINMVTLVNEIKSLIIDELELEDISIDDIETD